MILSFISFVLAAAQDSNVGGGGISSSVIIAIITAMATFGGAFLMFRGKTQDTANWLIVELRNEAKAAREAAAECTDERIEQAEKIEVLEAQVRSLTRRVKAAEEAALQAAELSAHHPDDQNPSKLKR